MVNKAPRSTAKQIQADLQTQGTTVSTHTMRHQLNERGFYGRRPRRNTLLRERERDTHKKAQLEFAKTHLKKPKSFWENVMWTDETKLEIFSESTSSLCAENKMKPSKKRTPSLQSSMEEVQ